MKKFPFSKTGFVLLQESLFALRDAERSCLAKQLNADLQTWTMDHFDLDAAQLDFLYQLDPRALRFLASAVSYAVEHRLPVSICPHAQKTKPTQQLLWAVNRLSTCANAHTFTASGSLAIHLSY